MDMPVAPLKPNDTPLPVIDHLTAEPSKRGSVGSVIAILLIVVLLVVGAFYVWGQRLAEQESGQMVPVVGE